MPAVFRATVAVCVQELFLDYNRNPFKKYFVQGLNVSLSTGEEGGG